MKLTQRRLIFVNELQVNVVGKAAVKSDAPVAKRKKKDWRGSKKSNQTCSGMTAFTGDMTMDEVQTKVNEAEAKKKRYEPLLRKAKKEHKDLTREKCDANRQHKRLQAKRRRSAAENRRANSNDVGLQIEPHAQSSRLYSREETEAWELVVSKGKAKKAAYTNLARYAEEVRSAKAILYAGNKILRDGGIVADDGVDKKKDDKKIVKIDDKTWNGLFDGEKHSPADLLTLSDDKNVFINSNDPGKVFQNCTTSMSGRQALEMTYEFGLMLQNRFTALTGDSNTGKRSLVVCGLTLICVQRKPATMTTRRVRAS
jgi:hypothetical protein